MPGFQSDAGPWTVLAADALVEDEGTYKPDFSAHAGSERLRCIRVSKASFDTITSLSKQEMDTQDVNLKKTTSADGEAGTNGVYNSNGSAGGGNASASTPTRRFFVGKQRTPSPKMRPRSISASGSGSGRWSPKKTRKGVPSTASLKILQAITGGSVSSALGPEESNVDDDRDRASSVSESRVEVAAGDIENGENSSPLGVEDSAGTTESDPLRIDITSR